MFSANDFDKYLMNKIIIVEQPHNVFFIFQMNRQSQGSYNWREFQEDKKLRGTYILSHNSISL